MSEAAFDAHFYDDLAETGAEAWRLLARGVADRRAALHTVQLATLGLDGAPRLRTVVLRGVDPAAGTLRVHTDARSSKVAELAAEPRVELHGYDARAKIQLRLRGLAEVHAAGPVADAAWAATGQGSRASYRAPVPPGSPITAPVDGEPVAGDGPEAGREAFRAITVTVARLEWLYLAARGHRRAAFLRDGDGWRGAWLAP